MIIGIGSDLIDITRVAKVIERHGDRFLDRIFTDAERAKAERRAKNHKMVVATYAKRFAANPARGLVARHGGGQPARWPADHATDRRGAGPAWGADAAGL
jgi:holo-[acyl-carrier protein] synthase